MMEELEAYEMVISDEIVGLSKDLRGTRSRKIRPKSAKRLDRKAWKKS